MSIEYTFAMIKPGVTKRGETDEVLNKIESEGFEIIKKQKLTLTREKAEGFYAEHKLKPFFGKVIDYIVSGEVIPMILKKENAVLDFRKLLGNTNPELADEGTIRKIFGESKTDNAVHGSDCDESANREIEYFFGKNIL